MDAHPIDIAAKIVGSQVALAGKLKVSKAAVNQWKLDGREVPFEHCNPIEQATAGKVRRWHLRPNDWHQMWPELIGVPGAPKVPKAKPARVVAA